MENKRGLLLILLVLISVLIFSENVSASVTIENLLQLSSIILPACSSSYDGNIGRNSTGIYYCNSTAWKNIA